MPCNIKVLRFTFFLSTAGADDLHNMWKTMRYVRLFSFNVKIIAILRPHSTKSILP